MIFYTVLLWRLQGTTQQEFETSWLGEHQRLARGLPGIIDVRLLPRAPRSTDIPESPDGIGLLVFASLADLDAALCTPLAATLREHTSTFAEADRTVRLVARDPAVAADG